jgi:SAM-dependent MidA family methyltransferase
MQLSEIIINRIRNEGPISFCDFMEMSLYYPDLGYYTSPQDRIGEKGDFYTSSSLTHLFGVAIGKQLEEMACLLDEKCFTIVEYGGGTGLLCHDILDYLKNNKELYGRLRYCMIEKSPVMRKKQKAHLPSKVSWHDSIHEIPEITGCILSNELVDNFSVHQVVMEDELMEVFVDYRDGFVELLKPASRELKDYLDELDIHLPAGFRTEINVQATEWIKQIALSLKRGYVLTVDYGYPSDELYRECRRHGTIMCYYKHQISADPYQNLGEQDITSHINFSALRHWGLKYELGCCGFTNQAHFLLSLGLGADLNAAESSGQDIIQLASKQSFVKHALLVGMGNKYKVLIQNKGIDPRGLLGLKPLPGLRDEKILAPGILC